MTKALPAALLLALSVPAPLLSQARVAGPQAHALPTHAALTAPPTEARQLRAGKAPTVGLVVGGVLGAAFGTYVGMAACSFDDDDQTNCTLKMPAWGLVGAAVVGGLGWVVGKALGGRS